VFDKILVPTDLSEISESLVADAGRIPHAREIILLHIMDTSGHTSPRWTDGTIADEVRHKLCTQQDLLKSRGIEVRSRILEDPAGNIPEAILRVAETEKPSIIIMGARKGLLSGYMLGRGVAEILGQSRTHILIARSGGFNLFGHARSEGADRNIFSKILFPIDFSRPAKDALAQAGHIEGIREIILLHVIRKIEKEESMNLQVREVEKRLADAREDIKKICPDVRVKMMVRFGDPLRQICTVAGEENVTLIMMSRYGKMDYIRQIPVGTTTADVAREAKQPVFVVFTEIHLHVTARELKADEFYFAEKIWFDYHQTKSDPEHDRIFCIFVEDTPVSVARCKRHPDGYEVDGVYTWDEFRGKGYAKKAMDTLITACGNEDLYMHAVLSLKEFYASIGFEPIPEHELPRTIRERYAWAIGDMEGAEVCPMRRVKNPGYDAICPVAD
jgi:nucleotide-binding universal stress UspA family protein